VAGGGESGSGGNFFFKFWAVGKMSKKIFVEKVSLKNANVGGKNPHNLKKTLKV